MQNLPTPILGEISAITITTTNLDESEDYYKKLGFYEVGRSDWPFPWRQITDNVLLIMLRTDPKIYMALTYYVKELKPIIKNLESKGIVFYHVPKKEDTIQRYTILTDDGFWISLVGNIAEFNKPKGPGMLTMAPEDYFRPEKYTNKTIGLFGELAHPVKDLTKSIEYWQVLGFQMLSKQDSPYPWAIISDGLSIVGLHETKDFSYPAITYFASDMRNKIQLLRNDNLTNITEKNKSNVILTTPEQQHFFLFQMGMEQEGSAIIPQTVEIKLTPIAVVSNERKTPIDDNWGEIISEITLTEVIPEIAFKNISNFSHLEIIYYFDKAEKESIIFAGKPRGIEHYEVMGIFAQRKKDRPNHIGICIVELLEHNGKILKVKGLDAIDGTPVLDIKPVFKEFLPTKEIKQADWVTDMMKNYW